MFNTVCLQVGEKDKFSVKKMRKLMLDGPGFLLEKLKEQHFIGQKLTCLPTIRLEFFSAMPHKEDSLFEASSF